MRNLCMGLAIASCLLGCATTQGPGLTVNESATPFRLCDPRSSETLVALELEFNWRSDQKDPEGRMALASNEVVRSLEQLGCTVEVDQNSLATNDGVAESASVDTKVLKLVIRELGPELEISVPVLWSSYSRVSYSLFAYGTGPDLGETVLHAEVDVRIGGPFAVRGAKTAAREFGKTLVVLLDG